MWVACRRVINKHVFRVAGIGMLAFPEPLISNSIGLCLLAVSFWLPDEPNLRRGDAHTCGCDYHIRALHSKAHIPGGAGALLPPLVMLRKLERREAYRNARYGFVTGPAVPPMAFDGDKVVPAGSLVHGWRSMPKLEGALLRRLSGVGSGASMRCQYGRAGAVAMA